MFNSTDVFGTLINYLGFSKALKNNINSAPSINDALPEELILKIFSYLSPKEIYPCALTCKLWYVLSNENSLWKHFYKREFFINPHSSETAKESYRADHIIPLNILNRNFTIMDSNGPSQKFLQSISNDKSWKPLLFKIANDKLFTAYHDSIEIIDIKTRQMEIIKFLNEDQPISCIEVSANSNILFAGYQNSLIEVWDIKEKKCIAEFKMEDYSKPVTCLFAYKTNVLFAGYQDGKIIEWNIKKPAIYTKFEDPKNLSQKPIKNILTLKNIDKPNTCLFVCTDDQYLFLDKKKKIIRSTCDKHVSQDYVMADFEIMFTYKKNGILYATTTTTEIEQKYICRYKDEYNHRATWLQYNNGKLYVKVGNEITIYDFTSQIPSFKSYISSQISTILTSSLDLEIL